MKKIATKHTTKNYTILTSHNDVKLYSYNTHICTIDLHNQYIYVTSYYDYSATTKRHLRWFFEDAMGWAIGVNDIRKALETNTTINGYTVELL